jgi:large subunit ribosomal protein L5
MQTISDKQKKTFDAIKAEFGYTNIMQTPRLEKVVVSVGVGSVKDKKRIELIADRISKITGQKAASRTAKKSIATFKVREGDLAGYQVTLRGQRMTDFLDKLVHIALPRTKDFRGIPAKFDEMGNYSLGIKEHTIFPETSDEDLKDVFSFGITIVTSTRDKKASKALLSYLGFPFKAE